ncbi:MAG: hypothetical protein AB7I59_08555 [Geminicoccaceae bacterium]
MGRGSVFFSYAWDDDRGKYISSFHEASLLQLGARFHLDPDGLNRLGVEKAEDLVFFDQTNQARMGVTKEWLGDMAARAEVLVLSAGPAHLGSDWCLFDW